MGAINHTKKWWIHRKIKSQNSSLACKAIFIDVRYLYTGVCKSFSDRLFFPINILILFLGYGHICLDYF
jgi:hypothetical protein